MHKHTNTGAYKVHRSFHISWFLQVCKTNCLHEKIDVNLNAKHETKAQKNKMPAFMTFSFKCYIEGKINLRFSLCLAKKKNVAANIKIKSNAYIFCIASMCIKCHLALISFSNFFFCNWKHSTQLECMQLNIQIRHHLRFQYDKSN